MARRLITCPHCGKDQHVYRDRLVRHQGMSILTCDGSGLRVSETTGEVSDKPLGLGFMQGRGAA